MRGDAEQRLALGERLAHETQRAVLEVAQAAVNQLAGGRRGGAGEIAFLDEQDPEPAPGRIARDPGAVDAAADDEEVVVRVPPHGLASDGNAPGA